MSLGKQQSVSAPNINPQMNCHKSRLPRKWIRVAYLASSVPLTCRTLANQSPTARPLLLLPVPLHVLTVPFVPSHSVSVVAPENAPAISPVLPPCLRSLRFPSVSMSSLLPPTSFHHHFFLFPLLFTIPRVVSVRQTVVLTHTWKKQLLRYVFPRKTSAVI